MLINNACSSLQDNSSLLFIESSIILLNILSIFILFLRDTIVSFFGKIVRLTETLAAAES